MAFGMEAQQLVRLGKVLATSDHASVVSINLFVALICGCIVIGHLLEERRWMNESITALVIGVCTGVLILLTTKGKSSHIFIFSEDLFFIYLLPPIIFNAGFQVKKKQFFRNFMTIMLFGAVGTLISFFIIFFGNLLLIDYQYAVSLYSDAWTIGRQQTSDYPAINCDFDAYTGIQLILTKVLNQDETPLLYSLVFGEGVVNDATSVVLFNAIQNFDHAHIDAIIILKIVVDFGYLFLSSTLLGAFGGLLSAYIIKKLYIGRHSTNREVALMILMAYLSYMLTEYSSVV
ncbi:Sodium hydrogen exchanger [Musa troglodytarum]|uniref:Sodium hydrogen exchanger n=1 Tax=Musa troglodytarum TaxID=320322 RepID=A0A9E7IGQ6_9LILI|nr:Sodium hydrogen exchanger [Musa troglodytarum]